ncbi:hypothetical protein QVD17_37823 [Tagetes erecta]|uniref:Uncharacterized protein n=1 Tax=Tagetes erecta TaxID=13708 RepID=A0AAD8JXH6_TARER|nr:hypothetical protein QVD17_37823 [Tagetes erecta]
MVVAGRLSRQDVVGIDEEVDALPDTEPFSGKFVIDLGYLPCMTTTLEKDGDPNMNDEGSINDDSKDEDSYHSDEDDETNEDSDDDESCANGLVESGYSSEDSD